MKGDLWKLLHVFENRVRIEIVRLLLRFEMMSLSDVAEKLEDIHGWKITLPGLLKHIRELEDIGIIRQESGIYLPEPDARKTIYFLEGKERVQEILQQLGSTIHNLLRAGVVFHETSKLAQKVQRRAPRLFKKDKIHLEALLAQCESEEVNKYLTEDERKKVKFWRMMITFSEK